jgi:hypothetical protein
MEMIQLPKVVGNSCLKVLDSSVAIVVDNKNSI